MTDLQKRMTEVLEETIQYYSEDTSRRAIDAFEGCMYLSDDGRMCAVGRCLINPKKAPEGKGVSGFGLSLDVALKQEYRGLPESFWIKLQMLHDFPAHWGTNKLTTYGEKVLLGVREWVAGSDHS